MLTFVTLIHLFLAVVLIVFVLLQDSKGGGAAGMFGGGSSNTLFGSTGGADFLTKMTRYIAIGFALSCLTLAYITSTPEKSLMDDYVPPAATDTPPATIPGTADAPAAKETSKKETVPSTDTAPSSKEKKDQKKK